MPRPFRLEEFRALPHQLVYIGRAAGSTIIIGGYVNAAGMPLLNVLRAPEDDPNNLSLWSANLNDPRQVRWIGVADRLRVLVRSGVSASYGIQARLPVKSNVDYPHHQPHFNNVPLTPLGPDELASMDQPPPQAMPETREEALGELLAHAPIISPKPL